MLRNLQFKTGNTRGFSLIELMIVIAIIGVLAAIAIPNFIAYRNKAFCSVAETDANSIALEVADYFATPTNRTVSSASIDVSVNNPWTVNTDMTGDIVIEVTDGSGRCPQNYREALSASADATGYWDGQSYKKVVRRML